MKKVFSVIGSFILCGLGFIFFTAIFSSLYIVPVFPVILAVLIYFFTKTQRTFIKKKATPIYQLTEGLVKIEGMVNAPATLETPFFKEQCIGYSYKRAEIYVDSDGMEHENNITQQSNFLEFYLSNATGKIKVNPDGLSLTHLPAKSKDVRKIRHKERTLKNGDEITILGNVVKNEKHEFELQKLGKSPFTVSTEAIISQQHKAFRTIKFLLPYIILMYVLVNYFLFFAPIKIQMKQNDIFVYFSFFGMPILAIISGSIGNKMDGFSKLFFSNLAGICLGVSILTFPLLCLLFVKETEFYRILCIWSSVFFCTTLAFIMNYRRLDGIFETPKKQ